MRRSLIRQSHTYSQTLNLPKSSLPNRPNKELIPERVKTTCDDLYKWQLEHLTSPRVLHDGPPYANGALHLGHAMNKILKDMINRSNVLKGHKVLYTPGWDCHGLPIENASKELAKKRKQKLDTNGDKRRHANALALDMVEKQMAGFRQFAVMADWDNSVYKTLSSDYVVRQLRVFAQMMADGLVYRQRKPVYWSVESGTALAESELQYEQQTSLAIYVKYPMNNANTGESAGSAVIWTTTPWTIPANRAIALGKDIKYAFVRGQDNEIHVVAENLIAQVPELEGGETIRVLSGEEIAQDYHYNCPLTGETRPFIIASHVTDEAGTGLVHTSTGHGKEDYLAGIDAGIPVYCPVDGKGKYTDELHPKLSELVGEDARKSGNSMVVSKLESCGALLHKHKITHSVPFDWRSKTPVMVRSTPQFFVDLSDVRQKALEAIENVRFNPNSGRARLSAFIQSRTEWCVSRQRVWGVPIPVFFNKDSDEVLMDPEVVEHVIATIESYGDEGLEKWFAEQENIEEWLPATHAHFAKNYRKGTDTMDVWFDSGTSWTQFKDDLLPVSYYLEGSDQHRGWFQSSLLTRVATSNKSVAPFQNLITHGMILDENGQKMSKSLKNVTPPEELINGNRKFKALGIDGLRLFIAQTDYTSDVILSPIAVGQVAATIKKLRLTFKYLLGNLDGYKPGEPVVLSPADKYTLGSLHKFAEVLNNAYEEQNFSLVVKSLNINMNALLSSFYFDISKDVLYTEAPSSPRRRAIQYVLSEILTVYLRVLSPVTPLLCQEVWEHSPDYITQGHVTPLMLGWPKTQPEWVSPDLDKEFEIIRSLKDVVNDTIELARNDKKVGSSLACEIYIQASEDKAKVLEKYKQYLGEFLIVSRVELGEAPLAEWSYQKQKDGYSVTATSPSSHKCPRCWQYTAPIEDTLCGRCDEIVHNLDN